MILRGTEMENQKGLTLLEITVATTILVIISGAVFQMFITHLRAQEVSTNLMVVSENNQLGLRKMAEELLGTDEEFVNVTFNGNQGSRTLPPLSPAGSAATVTVYSSITFKRIISFDFTEKRQVWSEDITFQRNTTTNEIERIEDGQIRRITSYASNVLFYNSPSGGIGIILTTTKGDLTGARPTGAQIEDRIEVYPVNKGTD